MDGMGKRREQAWVGSLTWGWEEGIFIFGAVVTLETGAEEKGLALLHFGF